LFYLIINLAVKRLTVSIKKKKKNRFCRMSHRPLPLPKSLTHTAAPGACSATRAATSNIIGRRSGCDLAGLMEVVWRLWRAHVVDATRVGGETDSTTRWPHDQMLGQGRTVSVTTPVAHAVLRSCCKVRTACGPGLASDRTDARCPGTRSVRPQGYRSDWVPRDRQQAWLPLALTFGLTLWAETWWPSDGWPTWS